MKWHLFKQPYKSVPAPSSMISPSVSTLVAMGTQYKLRKIIHLSLRSNSRILTVDDMIAIRLHTVYSLIQISGKNEHIIWSTLALFLRLIFLRLFQNLYVNSGVFRSEFFAGLDSISGVIFYIKNSCFYFPENIPG